MIIKRGDIFLANLEPVLGSEQGKTRPCVIVQNDTANMHSPNTIIAPLTSKVFDKDYPNNVFVRKEESLLDKDSVVLCSQIRVISIEHRLIKKIGFLQFEAMRKVDEALKVSLGLD